MVRLDENHCDVPFYQHWLLIYILRVVLLVVLSSQVHHHSIVDAMRDCHLFVFIRPPDYILVFGVHLGVY